MKYKVNEHVRVKMFERNHINATARVNAVDEENELVYLTNLNMPFMGTLCNAVFHVKEIEKL